MTNTVNLQQGLVAHWTFDDRAVFGNTLYDRSPNDAHAEIDPLVETGKDSPVGQAFEFDDSNDDHVVTDPIDLTNVAEITWSLLVYRRGGRIIAQYSSGDEYGPQLYRRGGSLGGYWSKGSEGSDSFSIGGTTAGTAEWERWTIKWEDGELVGAINSDIGSISWDYDIDGYASGGFSLGSRRGSFMYDGLISDVRIYDRPLSEKEMMTLANIRVPRHRNI